jgi:hypothetical protein
MTMALSTAARTARAQAIVTSAGANAKIKFYDGTRPASGAAVTTQALLALATAGAVLGTAAAGALDFDEASITQNNATFVSGAPTWVRITTSADVFVADVSIPADMSFLGTIATGLDISFGAMAITEGNA